MISITELKVSIITEKQVTLDVVDDEVREDQQISGMVDLKSPILCVYCTLYDSQSIYITGSSYVDKKSNHWRAMDANTLRLESHLLKKDHFEIPDALVCVGNPMNEV